MRVSFQLPSLHVSTLSLGLLEKISKVRKSGLTFAVETPLDYRQLSINKQVTLDMVKDILLTAKKRGWKSAKFYFMIGLPLANADKTNEADAIDEEDAIVSFMNELKRIPLTLNVNIGVFVPKPHTPYQWERQLLPDTAFRKLISIKERLRSPRCKVSFQDPFISMLEGILSRGGERVGEWVETAYRRGARLDAWSDFFKREIWESVLSEHTGEMLEILDNKDTTQQLPWDCIKSGVGRGYLVHEKTASESSELTSPCKENCTHPCGACASGKQTIVTNQEFTLSYINNNTSTDFTSRNNNIAVPDAPSENSLPSMKNNTALELPAHRIVFTFEKMGASIFLSHLNLVSVFQMAIQRAGLDAAHTAGFNPMPRLDFAAPLALGIAGEEEVATLDTNTPVPAADFINRLNTALPRGIRVLDALVVTILPGQKKHAPAALYAGAVYTIDGVAHTVTAQNEKTQKTSFLETHGTLYSLTRKTLFAHHPAGSEPLKFLDLYAQLYGRNTPPA
jgi:radical SAM-linked protein